jgi:hypothetical protein
LARILGRTDATDGAPSGAAFVAGASGHLSPVLDREPAPCRYGAVAASEEPDRRRAARAAAVALQQAVLTRRRHPGHERLWRSAAAAAAAAVRSAAGGRALRLAITRDEVRQGGAVLLHHAADEAPFGLLAAAGIGALEFAPDVDERTLALWIDRLAAAPRHLGPDRDPALMLDAEPLPGVRHLVATTASTPTVARSTPPPDWWLLPEPDPACAGLHDLVDRDEDANLPAVAARIVLADLDEHATAGNVPTGVLTGLFAAMLARGDASACTWLLEAAQHHAAVPADDALRLRDLAAQAFYGAWLRDRLAAATDAELRPLLAMAMQLGDDGVQHLVHAATAAGCALPPWLREGW